MTYNTCGHKKFNEDIDSYYNIVLRGDTQHKPERF